MIPFFDATRKTKKEKGEILSAVRNVLDSGRFVMGEKMANFEKEFSSYLGVSFGVGVNSGTDALKIALRSLGIKEGDEVITVSNTATPTVSAIREIGAIPVFTDIDEYFTMKVSGLPRKISKKTKAIVPVHLYGHPADMEEIMKFARENNLFVVEDCAQSAGAEIGGKKVGSFGNASAWSFYPTKNLSACGDGGMITTKSKEIAEKSAMLRMYGMKGTYFSHVEGWNSRLDEIQSAILSINLKYLDKRNQRRIEIAGQYISKIKNPAIILPKKRPETKHVFHLFVARTKKRDKLTEYLKEKSIGMGIHYPFPVHLQKAYEFLGYKEGSLPETEKVAKEILSLPIFPELTDEEIEYIIKEINNFK